MFGVINVLFFVVFIVFFKVVMRVEIWYVKVINLCVISINLLVVLLELVMFFN